MTKILRITTVLSIFLLFYNQSFSQIVRVNVNSPCAVGCDGSTWALAYTSLKTAIDNTTSGEIWVAQGTYTPDGANRDSSFLLQNNVGLYGGFDATETMRSQRDYTNNLTILSGDLSGNDGANFTNYADNSYHVVRATKVNNTGILDGFTIRGGNANDITFPDYIGAGFYNDGEGAGNSSTPIVQNCHFTENFADRSGGAIFNYGGTSGNANMTIQNCQFTLNIADDGGALYNDGQGFGQSNPIVEGCYFAANTAINGGAIYNYGVAAGNSNPTIVNCLIIGNKADRGGGMYNDGSAVGHADGSIVNCTFSGNEATIEGSAVYNFGGFGGNTSPNFNNCVFWDNSTPTDTSSIHNSDATPFINYSLIEESTCPGINSTCDANTVFNQNPEFNALVTAAAPTTTGDFQFRPCSPLRDAGNNAMINATGFTIDYQDSSRIYTGTVDIGAYEFNNTPAELAISTIITNALSCPGSSDANIDLTISDGLLPYVFAWDNGIGAVEDPTNLGAGTYIITVTDGYNCLQTDTIIISNPDTIQINIVITSNYNGFPISCNGATDGAVDLTATGGAGNYTYQWSYNNLAAEDPMTLPAGKHYVTVTDANGCSVIDSVTLTQPNALTASASVTSNFNGFDLSCPNSSDATINTTVTGGKQPYTFAWTGGLPAVEDPINVSAGTYFVTVTDLNGCQILTLVTVTPPPGVAANLAVSSNFNGSDISCVGATDGSIDLTASGGASPYTYNWDNGIGAIEDPTNLSAGTYRVTVTDVNGCTEVDSITLNAPVLITPIAVISSNYNGQNISCNGGNDGSIDLTITGGSGALTYNWDNGAGTNQDPTNLVAGTYNVTVTDANGCTETTSITLNEPTPVTGNAIITTNYNGFDVSCTGANDGAVNLTASGGTPTYTYLWDGGIGVVEDPNTLDTGVYNVTITDLNGCTGTTSVTLSGPAGLDLTVLVSSNFNGEDISCVGASDGAINLSVSGGAMPYTYNWDNGIGNVEDPNGLVAGAYSVTVTDANGCSNQASIVVNDPPAMGATIIESTPIDCNGNSTGALDLTATGGVPPYVYNWDNGIGATEDPTNLAAGTYNLTITDANGCQFTTSYILNEPTDITANAVATSSFNGFEISCFGENDGTIDLTAGGGTAPYTYNWDNGIGATEDPTNLVAGTYNVTVTDANGCTETTSITLNEPTPVTGNAIITTNYNGFDVSCTGANDGAADLTAGGGVAPYTYLWDGGIGVIEDPNTLDTGVYNVTITDLNGCTGTTSVTLSGPAGLDLTVLVSSNFNGEDISCVGASDGAINLSVSGGAMPYTYNWDNGIGNVEDPNGLVAGAYSVTVTDANGCSNQASIVVNDPPAMGATIIESTPIDCNGNSTGALDLTATGGVPPYVYNWDNGIGATEDPTNLAAGTYNLTITDANGCQFTTSYILNEPTDITANAVATSSFNGFEISCFGENDGTIDLTAGGGTAPYTYNWDNGIGATEDPTNLVAGTYNVTVTDANGCTETTSITLNEPTPVTGNAIITTNYNGFDVSCTGANDGAADLTAGGGVAPYTYLWDGGIGVIEDPNTLDTGVYNVTITDLNGCTGTTSVTLSGPAGLDLTVLVSSNFNGEDISCVGASDGAINLSVSGGAMPYTYNWDNGIGNVEDPNGLMAGAYSVTVTDANGCSNQASIVVNDPPAMGATIIESTPIDCNGNSTGALDLTATGGVAPYIYNWDNGIGATEDPTNLAAGTYNLTITDANGCQFTTSYTIAQPGILIAAAVSDTTYNGFDVSCFGANDGRINLTTLGGTAPYTYNWNGGIGNIEDPTNLFAGTYNVTVTDSNGCTETTSINLLQPTAITSTALVTSNYNGLNVSCIGANDGAADLTVNGGLPNYTYLWSNGAIVEDPINLDMGTYKVVITDLNGCMDSTTVTLTGPDPIIPIAIVSSNYNGLDITCVGANDGSVDLSVIGGAMPYTYNWNNGFSTNEDISNLLAGTYQVIVTDANGCKDSTSIQVNDPMPLNLSVVQDSLVTCFGDANGAINTTITGGTGTYIYNWDNGIGAIEDPNGLSAGTYNLTVTDGNGCTATETITLSQPGIFIAVVVSDTTYNGFDVSCNGASDGRINLTTAGGTMPYSYIWSTGDTIPDLDSLASGNYSVTVTDTLGCEETTSIFLSEPIAIFSSATHIDPTCFGISDGSIDLTANGGVLPYSYNWDNGIGNVEDPINITAATYTVTITDANGCQDSLTETLTGITVPLSITGVVSSNYNGQELSCPTSSDGAIDVTPFPIASYTYAWSNGLPNTEDQSNLGAGTYFVTATDVNGCQDTTEVTINAPDSMQTTIVASSNYNGSPISCNGANDANLDLNILNGVAPYTYLWSTTDTIQDPTGIGVGVSFVTITDANGCVVSDSIVLAEPTTITSSVVVTSDFNGNDISCSGATDGALDLTVSGGTAPYSYLWTSGDTIQDPDSLGAGTYQVTITDANGCQDSAVIIIDEPSNSISVIGTSAFPVCGNATNGVIALNVTGGAGGYIFNWNNGLPNTPSQMNLGPGIYQVTVTDASNCFASDTIVIDSLPIPIVSFEADTVCVGLGTSFFDNSIAPNSSTYAWDFDNNGTTDDNTIGNTLFEYPGAGTFTSLLIVTTPDGCKDSAQVDVYVEDIMVSFSGLDIEYCGNADIIELIGLPDGGVFSGDGIVGNMFDPSLALVGTNTISYTYTSPLGCSETISESTQILPLPNLEAGEDITGFVNTPIPLQAIGATAYLWSPVIGLDAANTSNPTAMLFETQTYIVTGTDANGCSVTDTITVTIDNDLGCLKLRTVFSPNGDNVNDEWSIECVSLYDNTVEVYNRWGQLVFQETNYNNTWTGISITTGEPLPEDSYFYVVKITTLGREQIFKGAVTIVR